MFFVPKYFERLIKNVTWESLTGSLTEFERYLGLILDITEGWGFKEVLCYLFFLSHLQKHFYIRIQSYVSYFNTAFKSYFNENLICLSSR